MLYHPRKPARACSNRRFLARCAVDQTARRPVEADREDKKVVYGIILYKYHSDVKFPKQAIGEWPKNTAPRVVFDLTTWAANPACICLIRSSGRIYPCSAREHVLLQPYTLFYAINGCISRISREMTSHYLSPWPNECCSTMAYREASVFSDGCPLVRFPSNLMSISNFSFRQHREGRSHHRPPGDFDLSPAAFRVLPVANVLVNRPPYLSKTDIPLATLPCTQHRRRNTALY